MLGRLLALLVMLPLCGAALCGVMRRGERTRPQGVRAVAAATLGGTALWALGLLLASRGAALRQPLWRWFEVAALRVEVALTLDAFSAVALAVLALAAAVRAGDAAAGPWWRPALLHLLVAATAVALLADNLLVVYAGWLLLALCNEALLGPGTVRLARGGAAVLLLASTLLFWSQGGFWSAAGKGYLLDHEPGAAALAGPSVEVPVLAAGAGVRPVLDNLRNKLFYGVPLASVLLGLFGGAALAMAGAGLGLVRRSPLGGAAALAAALHLMWRLRSLWAP